MSVPMKRATARRVPAPGPISALTFAEAFERVKPAIATDETRPQLHSVELRQPYADPGFGELVATDGHRLHRAIFYDAMSALPGPLLLDPDLIGKGDSVARAIFRARLPKATTYVDWLQVWPKNAEPFVSAVRVSDLADPVRSLWQAMGKPIAGRRRYDALDSTGVTISHHWGAARLSMKRGASAHSPDVEGTWDVSTVSLPQGEGEPETVSYDANYLLDAFAGFDVDDPLIGKRGSDPLGPLVLEGAKFSALIMPMRI